MNPDSRRWLVWIDDNPLSPDMPLEMDSAVSMFAEETLNDPSAIIEIRQVQ